MIRIEVTLNEDSTPADVQKVADWLVKLPEMPWACAEASPSVLFGEQPDGSIRRKNLPDIPAPDFDAKILAALERENPQFGQQPLPPGAAPTDDDAGSLGMPGAPLLPLAPSGAPSPAAVEASASAPAATLASIPPPPSAASPVPSPPPAAATPAPAAAVDAKGLPWDERIHASSRAKIADGSWRMKRGVQSHVVEAVEAELRAQMGLVGQSGSTVALDAAPADGASVPPPPAPAPLPPGPPALTFGIVASRIGKAVTAGALSGNVLSVKLAELGFPDGLHTVNARPDMWQKILDTLGA